MRYTARLISRSAVRLGGHRLRRYNIILFTSQRRRRIRCHRKAEIRVLRFRRKYKDVKTLIGVVRSVYLERSRRITEVYVIGPEFGGLYSDTSWRLALSFILLWNKSLILDNSLRSWNWSCIRIITIYEWLTYSCLHVVLYIFQSVIALWDVLAWLAYSSLYTVLHIV
jgi:hypothetical protein